MTAKQIVLDALNRLPEEISFYDISEEVAFLTALREGEEQIKNGQVISNDQMKSRLDSWVSK
ncbi:MAG: hypothetical protein ACR2H1_09555 [Limisphaerales bacterium]